MGVCVGVYVGVCVSVFETEREKGEIKRTSLHLFGKCKTSFLLEIVLLFPNT